MSEAELGLWIPKEIWLMEDLTIMEALYLSKLLGLSKGGKCSPSNEYLGTYFGLTKSRSAQIISSLRKKKKIKTTILKDGNKTVGRVINLLIPLYQNTNSNNISTNTPIHKKEKSSIFDGLLDNLSDDRKELLEKWLQYRRQVGKTYKSALSAKVIVGKFERHTVEALKYAVENSIANGWQGLFLKEAENMNPKSMKKYKEI